MTSPAQPAVFVMQPGSRWELVTTGHQFRVTGRPTARGQVEVEEGRTRRFLPTRLLQAAYQQGLLVPQEKD